MTGNTMLNVSKRKLGWLMVQNNRLWSFFGKCLRSILRPSLVFSLSDSILTSGGTVHTCTSNISIVPAKFFRSSHGCPKQYMDHVSCYLFFFSSQLSCLPCSRYNLCKQFSIWRPNYCLSTKSLWTWFLPSRQLLKLLYRHVVQYR